MTKLLVVRAHPLQAPVSRSMRVTDAFVAAYRRAHPDDLVEDLRLYEVAVPEIDLDLLDGWARLREGEHFGRLHPSQQAKLTIFDKLGEQFASSDIIVIANPLWNLSVPTRLKAWIDTVCVQGRTFRYTPEGRAEGLVHGKTVLHIQANGGHFGGSDPGSRYLKSLFTFLGVTDFRELFVEGMDHEPDRAEEIIGAAITRAEELARNC